MSQTGPTRAQSRIGPRRAGSILALALFGFFGMAALDSTAQTSSQHEYELKAGVLYHIIKYVEWPKDALANDSTAIQIGLLGQIPFADALEVLNGKSVQGHELIVKRLPDLQAAASCQVIFIGASEKSRLPEIIASLKDRPVLTVSEIDGFTELGGIVNLRAGPNRIVMEINHELARKARLNVSSQLLKLAKVPR